MLPRIIGMMSLFPEVKKKRFILWIIPYTCLYVYIYVYVSIYTCISYISYSEEMCSVYMGQHAE